MKPNTCRSRAPSARSTPLGYLIQPLLDGRMTAGEVLDRHFSGTRVGRNLRTAIRHGSLLDGRIQGPRRDPEGQLFRPSNQRPEDDINRASHHRAARRMLATFLMLVECMDPQTQKASGRQCWQGHIQRRLKLSSRRNERTGTINGVREVQRYVRILENAEALATMQPNAANVPDYMRGAPKPSIVKRKRGLHAWAYNVITLPRGFGLPIDIRNMLRRWRGLPVPSVPMPTAPIEVSAEVRELARSGPAAILAWLRSRPPAPA